MKSLVAAVISIALCTAGAFAAPGDPRAVKGTLEWPASLGSAPFIVLRADDGTAYYADIASAQRRGTGTVASGERLSVIGIEGAHPFEISAVAVGPGNSAIVGSVELPPSDVVSASPPSPPTPSVTPTPAPAPEKLWQIEGKVVSINGREMIVQSRTGQRSKIDITNLGPSTRQMVGPGDEIKLFGAARPDRRLVASGFLHLVPPPSASPATGR
jgi:hypothetical protein